MNRPDWGRLAERLAALAWPRRCPLCGQLLGPDAVDGVLCPVCAPKAKALAHNPPRLDEAAHGWYALSGAAAAYQYEGAVQRAILLAKSNARPWAAREFADLIAIRVFGAGGAQPGGRPRYEALAGFPLFDAIVPVPPRRPGTGKLPARLARRLGAVLGIPVLDALTPTRRMQPQKSLDRTARYANTRGGYAARRGADLSGKRLLLVDDILTTGATASACALALLEAGAVSVFAVTIAAAGEQKKPGKPALSAKPNPNTRPGRRKHSP